MLPCSSRNTSRPFQSWIQTTMCLLFVLVMPNTRLFAARGDQRYYALVEGGTGLRSTVQEWRRMSQLQCAERCSAEILCEGFRWDSSDGVCIVGRGVETSGNGTTTTPAPDTGTVRVYAPKTTCPYNLGYQLVMDGDSSARRCLHFSGSKATYDGAKGVCGSHGGRLVKSDTQSLVDRIAAKAGGDGGGDVFVGANDLATEDLFIWSDGTTMTSGQRQLFNSGEPNNNAGAEHCVVVTSKGLDDRQCDKKYNYVCEINLHY